MTEAPENKKREESSYQKTSLKIVDLPVDYVDWMILSLPLTIHESDGQEGVRNWNPSSHQEEVKMDALQAPNLQP